MIELVVLAGAESKLLAMYSQYESTLEGLGDLFDMEFQAACDQLCRFPEIGSPFGGRFRRFLMRRWHVGLFYTFTGTRIVVVAVFDLRQDPEIIKRDLGLL
jgi:hypothetical protein